MVGPGLTTRQLSQFASGVNGLLNGYTDRHSWPTDTPQYDCSG